MFTLAELHELQNRHSGAQFFIHNGYDGWSYGSPLNPTPVTFETACQLLNSLAPTLREESLRKELEMAEVAALEYATSGDALYGLTHGNRFLAFLSPDFCTYRDSTDAPQPRPQRLVPIHIPLPASERPNP